MFTVFSLMKSKPLSEEEMEWLHKMLAQYSMTLSGLWLQSLPWTRFEFRWCPAMNMDNGIMGCFSLFHPNTIYLQPYENADFVIKNPSGRVHWIEEIFQTIVHELRHAHQWKLSKLEYIVCGVPGLRQITLEADAEKAGKEAQKFADAWIRKQDYFLAAEHGIAEPVVPEEDENHG